MKCTGISIRRVIRRAVTLKVEVALVFLLWIVDVHVLDSHTSLYRGDRVAARIREHLDVTRLVLQRRLDREVGLIASHLQNAVRVEVVHLALTRDSHHHQRLLARHAPHL